MTTCMQRETCWHCETDPVRRKWKDPASYCSLCQQQAEAICCERCRTLHRPEAFCPELVAARLRTLLVFRQKGLARGSHVSVLGESWDVEQALREAHEAGVLGNLELGVLIARLVQGLGKKQTAPLFINPLTGRPVAPATIKRATQNGTRKLSAWLNGRHAPRPDAADPDDITPEDDPIAEDG